MADGKVIIETEFVDGEVKEGLNDIGDEAEKAAKGVDDLGDSAKGSGKSIGTLDVAVGNFVSGAAEKLVGALIDAVKSFVALADETREYREDMAKLNTAFKTAGHTTDAAKKAYDGFYKILGESDRSVEAVNHLAELTDNEEELAKWTDICAGVTAKFGDSLPIEGLTEAANETAKVGAVTGPLADALNWAGISEEKFNEQLAECNSEQERAALITSTLSTEYQAAAAEYNELTASTQAARDATNQMEQAQAQLGAAIEPLTTAWTELKATALSWVADAITPVITKTLEAKQGTDLLTAAQREQVTAAHEAAAAFRDNAQAAAEMAQGHNANINHVQTLWAELQTLADSTGRVEDADRARAEFILGELNEALGTEYRMNGNIIGQYASMVENIEAVISAKRAELLLGSYDEAYIEAIKQKDLAQQGLITSAQELAAQQAVLTEAEEKATAARAALTKKALAAKSEAEARALAGEAEYVKGLEAAAAEEKKVLEKKQEDYNELVATKEDASAFINAVEQAQTLVLQGETEKAAAILTKLGDSYEGAADTAQTTAAAEIEAAKQKVIDTSVYLGLLEAEYEENQTNMSEAQKKEALARIEAAKKEAKDARDEYYTVGGNMVEGMTKGANDKEWTLTGAIKSIVDRAVAAAKKASDSHSPSRRFAEEVGEPIAQGIAVGIEREADKPIEAARDVIDDLADYLEAEQKKTVKTVKDYNAEIAQINTDAAAEIEEINAEHNEKLKELAEKRNKDLKKKNADRKAIDEQYAKDVAAANERVTESIAAAQEKQVQSIAAAQEKIRSLINSKMAELVTLEADYKASVDALWSNLGNEIAALQDNYTSQLDSRAKSIASSLNLWSVVDEKTSVSSWKLTHALETQVDRLKDYNAAIDKLSARGVSDAFLDEIKGMGVDATGEIETLVSMSDKQLAEYVALWEEKSELSRQAATKELETLKEETLQEVQDLTAKAVDEYEQLRADYQTQATLLVTELSTAMKDAGETGYEELIAQLDNYTAAGGDLMDGVITGITTKAPALSDAVTSAVKRAIAAAKEAAGIASPSKVMRDEVGKFLPLGMAEGIAEAMPSVERQVQLELDGLTAKMQAAVSVESARVGQIYATQYDGTGDIVRAVGMQTAGINSLASEYRSGAGNKRPIILMLDRRELGRALVDVGAEETARVGLSY